MALARSLPLRQYSGNVICKLMEWNKIISQVAGTSCSALDYTL